jgi:RNA polymerase sigma-70 factor (ECF subfamily)
MQPDPGVRRSKSAEESARAEARREERELVARARSGDAEAFRALVDRHRDRAYGLALRIVRVPSEAEEVAQDAFVRVWRALPGFRGESSFGTWLHRIVARRAIDRAALVRGGRAREADLDAAGEPEAPERLRELDEALRARRLERLMDRLSEVQRAAMTLFYWEDRSVEDVAMRLGLPPNTVKTHLARARAVLRAAWMEEESP